MNMFSLLQKAEVVCVHFSSPLSYLMMEMLITYIPEDLRCHVNNSEITQRLSSIPEHVRFCYSALVLFI